MKIGYVYDDTVALNTYGPIHPMNPFRIEMTHSLVKTMGFEKHMDVYESTKVQLTYHPKSYLDNLTEIQTSDCPNMPNITDFCERYCSASINAAVLINEKKHDIVINWAGGLHHAHKTAASGFCYANDIVMCILELLKVHKRVMYVDIDCHHGDGVEDAFYNDDRVLTLSSHKYGKNFFPGTGSINTTDNKVVNIPLLSGTTDNTFKYIFEPIVSNAIRKFKPNVIVCQCGADSLARDKIGEFNITIGGHADAVTFIKDFNIPMVILGGGGYTIKNVARCWAYETGVLCGVEIPEFVPEDDPYIKYYGPDCKLNPELRMKIRDENDKEYLDAVKSYILDKIDKF